MAKIKSKQITKLMGKPKWVAYTLSAPPAATPFNVTAEVQAAAAVDTPQANSGTALGVLVANISDTADNFGGTYGKVYLRKDTGEAMTYTIASPSNIFQVYGSLYTDDSAGTQWNLDFWYIETDGTKTAIDPQDIDGLANGDTIGFRIVEVVEFQSITAGDMVDNFEGIDEIGFSVADTNAHLHVQEEQTPGSPLDTFTLSFTPFEGADVKMYVNGIKYDYGVDYTISGTTVTWQDVAFTLDADDQAMFEYETAV